MRTSPLVAATTLALLAWTTAVHAEDRPLDARKLVLKRSATKSSLVFVSKDPTLLFPTIGSADDPASGTPGGALVELFSLTEGIASLTIPAGAGVPGWTVKAAGVLQYKFENATAPGGISSVKVAVVKSGNLLKIAAKDAALGLTGGQGAVGIRITTGALRNCARFSDASVHKDAAGIFSATEAAAAGLADCSDEVLMGLPPAGSCAASTSPECGGSCTGDGVCAPTFDGCLCVSPSSPCGGTSPVCNGTCPAGEDCVAYGPGPFPECQCLPPGATACGDPGPPICGGECPDPEICAPAYTLPIFGGQLTCACGGAAPCGPGGIQCPAGSGCALIPPGTYLCVPFG